MQFSFKDPFKEPPNSVADLKSVRSIPHLHIKKTTLGIYFLTLSKNRTFYFDQLLKKFRWFFHLEKNDFISTSALLIYHS